ncbi:MAG: cyanophycin synthetase, partial [Bryobacterales bacterium]|jgi:cyanophycin synthetase|nr:cyanophycin synthetase [Bryobacterales bacterium]
VREGGTLVLNADDERLAALPQHPKVSSKERTLVYFGMNPNSLVIQEHLARGGIAFVAHRGWIELRSRNEVTRIVDAEEVPATLRGTADFQIYNILAATAACHAYGMDLERIADGLLSYRMDEDSEGRLNLYSVGGAFTLVDYGHNPAALRAVCSMIAKWRPVKSTGIITVPGDRSDELIAESARAAACGFDYVIIREDEDLRGRAPGEVANIIAQTFRQEEPELPVEIILDELNALSTALDRLMPGELVVAFCDQTSEVKRILEERGARPAKAFHHAPPVRMEQVPAA